MIILPRELEIIRSLMQPEESLFLVGGAIRDALLCRSNNDLDFVGTGDPRVIGRKLADKLHGAFFILDDERNACRVIAKNGHGARLIFDFSQMRGATLIDDLYERDFTINAMALNVVNPIELIDPLKGEQDLLARQLRPCKTSSFRDDPLRVIRAIRYSTKYDLQIDNSTCELLQISVIHLATISKERKRDELFKIFEAESPWNAIKQLEKFEILSHILLTDLPDIERAISRLKNFIEMVDCLSCVEQKHLAMDSAALSVCKAYSDNSENLRERFSQVNQSERSILALDELIVLFWDMNEFEREKAINALSLSREEQEHISLVLKNKRYIVDGFSVNVMPDRTYIYRYFHALSVAGLDLAILTLAEAAIDQFDRGADLLNWSRLVEFSLQLIKTWFNNHEYVAPKLFLTGRDLMFEFDIPQGPQIGKLLDGLRKEQAIGSIQNRTQALAWVDGQIQKRFIDR